MIRGLSIALAAALLVLPLGAHAQAQAQWDKTLHDFGTFHESQGNRSCAFAVKNDGDSPLVLTRVLSSCGCTVAKYDTEPIMPGKSGTVEITYSPTGRPGPFEKAVWSREWWWALPRRCRSTSRSPLATCISPHSPSPLAR